MRTTNEAYKSTRELTIASNTKQMQVYGHVSCAHYQCSKRFQLECFSQANVPPVVCTISTYRSVVFPLFFYLSTENAREQQQTTPTARTTDEKSLLHFQWALSNDSIIISCTGSIERNFPRNNIRAHFHGTEGGIESQQFVVCFGILNSMLNADHIKNLLARFYSIQFQWQLNLPNAATVNYKLNNCCCYITICDTQCAMPISVDLFFFCLSFVVVVCLLLSLNFRCASRLRLMVFWLLRLLRFD